MTKFNATVTTVILNGEAIELKDRIEFNGVDHGFIDYLAGSCRLVARKLCEGAQDPAGTYTLHYETQVTDAATGAPAMKRPKITNMGMTRPQVYAFLRLAMIELAEVNDLRYGEFSECRSDD